MIDRPISEQAVMSALQAFAGNPDYADFMHTMEQYWPRLRTITLHHHSEHQHIKRTVSHYHSQCEPTSDQPGHSRYGTLERSR